MIIPAKTGAAYDKAVRNYNYPTKTGGGIMALSLCGVITDNQGRELACHGTPAFPAACYHDDLARAPVPWHWHTELEAFVVAQGTALAAAGGERFALRRGEGFFVNSEVLHAVLDGQEPGCRLRSIVFHPRLVGGSLDSVFWTRYLHPLMGEDGPQYVRLCGPEAWCGQAVQAVEAACAACTEEPPGYEFQVRTALSELILLLARHRIPRASPKPAGALRAEERVKRMLEYIHSRYDAELTTAAIARSAMVSESECLRCFRAVIGMPPGQYVTQYRVRKAAELLDASALSVSEVGARCGFQDASYFAKTFRAQKGCSPSQYRGRER